MNEIKQLTLKQNSKNTTPTSSPINPNIKKIRILKPQDKDNKLNELNELSFEENHLKKVEMGYSLRKKAERELQNKKQRMGENSQKDNKST